MAVDLSLYLDNLKREINPPGVVLDTNASDDELLGHLEDAYWECVLDGIDYLRNNYTESNFTITPLNPGTPDLPRELIQLVILYAGIRIVKNRLMNVRTQYAARAGTVSIEYQNSSNMYQMLYKELVARRSITLRRLSDVGILPTVVFDSLVNQDFDMAQRRVYWER